MPRGPSPRAPTITSCVAKVQHQNQETDLGRSTGLIRIQTMARWAPLEMALRVGVTRNLSAALRNDSTLTFMGRTKFRNSLLPAAIYSQERPLRQVDPSLVPQVAPEATESRPTGGWGVHGGARRRGCSCLSSQGLSQALHDARTGERGERAADPHEDGAPRPARTRPCGLCISCSAACAGDTAHFTGLSGGPHKAIFVKSLEQLGT